MLRAKAYNKNHNIIYDHSRVRLSTLAEDDDDANQKPPEPVDGEAEDVRFGELSSVTDDFALARLQFRSAQPVREVNSGFVVSGRPQTGRGVCRTVDSLFPLYYNGC